MAIKTTPFDAAKYFPDAESQIELLNDALHEGHVGYIAAAIGTIARARGIASVAQEAGLSRQALHKALSATGNPTMDTVMKVLQELGIELEAKSKVLVPASD